MAPKAYRFHSDAWSELESADDWYLSRSLDASIAFLTDNYSGLEAIAEAPHRWPIIFTEPVGSCSNASHFRLCTLRNEIL